MEKKTILYIAGDGHSGTTLLDILLGAHNKAFSVGELNFLPEKGIKNKEFCSCGKPVINCDIWSKIISSWEEKRILKLDEYIFIQKKLSSKKNIISSYQLLKKPTGKILDYINDTHSLYEIIFKSTNSDYIIDSSKNPIKILILKHISFDFKVIHLVRRFGDVLNSNKKVAKKDLKAGIEHNIIPKKTMYVLFNWLFKNLSTIIFSKGVSYNKIHYEEIVRDPVKHITNLIDFDTDFTKKLNNRGPFVPRHLVAGNKIRMQNELFISDKPMNTAYSRLNIADKLLARSIDYFY